jgi:hypothetical protein
MGVVPLHVPVEALNVCPCCAVPLIVGGAVLVGDVAGGGGGGGGGRGALGGLATADVAADVAAAEPFRFVAVTMTRSVAPTPADVGV